jgi:hypothetical protein
MKWTLKLSEIDFVVEYRAGFKIGYINALSQHINAVMHEDILDRNNILHEQEKDTFCIKHKPGNYSSRR